MNPLLKDPLSCFFVEGFWVSQLGVWVFMGGLGLYGFGWFWVLDSGLGALGVFRAECWDVPPSTNSP